MTRLDGKSLEELARLMDEAAEKAKDKPEMTVEEEIEEEAEHGYFDYYEDGKDEE